VLALLAYHGAEPGLCPGEGNMLLVWAHGGQRD